MAFAGIGEFPGTLQSRVIVIPMRPAPAGTALEELEAGSAPELVPLRRQLAAWAADLEKLPVADMPKGLRNRDRDNWRPLLRIAALAGDQWTQHINAAAEASMQIERRPALIVRLLADIRDIFKGLPEPAEGSKVISTQDLIGRLTASEMEEAGWDEANHGHSITAHWLRERFVGVLDPPRSINWYEDTAEDQHQLTERRHVSRLRRISVRECIQNIHTLPPRGRFIRFKQCKGRKNQRISDG
jgi:hypothetical protein